MEGLPRRTYTIAAPAKNSATPTTINAICINGQALTPIKARMLNTTAPVPVIT
jgi:hypothetical protein